MARVKRGFKGRRAHKKWIKLAKGANGRRKNVFKAALEVAMRGLEYGYNDRKLKKRVIDEGLKPYLADNTNAWALTADGDYKRLKSSRGKRFCAQEALLAAIPEGSAEKR